MSITKIRKENLDGRLIIAKNLRVFRKELGLSQEKLGFASGLDGSYISGIERGERNVSIDNIERLSLALNKQIYELLMASKA